MVSGLSMMYLAGIGERVDALSVSNLLSAWNEVGFAGQDLQAFSMLRDLVLDKAEANAFFNGGCGTALVNIVKSCNEMSIDDSAFLDTILEGLRDEYDKLDIPW